MALLSLSRRFRCGFVCRLFGGESKQLVRYRARHFFVAFRVGVQEVCVLFMEKARVGGGIRIEPAQRIQVYHRNRPDVSGFPDGFDIRVHIKPYAVRKRFVGLHVVRAELREPAVYGGNQDNRLVGKIFLQKRHCGVYSALESGGVHRWRSALADLRFAAGYRSFGVGVLVPFSELHASVVVVRAGEYDYRVYDVRPVGFQLLGLFEYSAERVAVDSVDARGYAENFLQKLPVVFGGSHV